MGQFEAYPVVRLTRIYSRFPLPQEGFFALDSDVSNHLLRVLRLENGDVFAAFDGSGAEVRARLHADKRGRQAQGEILERAFPQVEMARRLTLYLALVKGERFDWAVEKATELGVFKIVPLISEFTAVRSVGAERVERWRRLAESAACQSGRVRVPAVTAPVGFKEALRQLSGPALIFAPGAGACAREELAGFSDLSLVVGPEGGFSSEEIQLAGQAGWRSVGLGRRILRVETAALAVLSLYGDI